MANREFPNGLNMQGDGKTRGTGRKKGREQVKGLNVTTIGKKNQPLGEYFVSG